MSQVLYSCITDIVLRKLQCGECLYWNITVDMWRMRRESLLPHCFVVHVPSIVLLHHRHCSSKASVWWVSVLKHNSCYVIDAERASLTTLQCNAWARSDRFGCPSVGSDSSVNVYARFQIESNIWNRLVQFTLFWGQQFSYWILGFLIYLCILRGL
jgi:hypothetical protein